MEDYRSWPAMLELLRKSRESREAFQRWPRGPHRGGRAWTVHCYAFFESYRTVNVVIQSSCVCLVSPHNNHTHKVQLHPCYAKEEIKVHRGTTNN